MYLIFKYIFSSLRVTCVRRQLLIDNIEGELESSNVCNEKKVAI